MELMNRLPKAALVTLASLLLFGGTIGFVTASNGDSGIPETMQVAAPQVGDEWAYTADYVYAEDGDEDSGQELLSFSWGESTIVYDRDGMPRHVQPLLDDAQWGAYFVDHETNRIVAQSNHYESTETRYDGYNPVPYGVSVLGIRPSFGSESNVNVTGSMIHYVDEPAPCGFRSSLHDGPRDLAEPVAIDGLCRDFDAEVGSAMFTAFEARSINGVPTVGFTAKDSMGETNVWYNPAIPYPVAIEYTLNDFVFKIDFGDEEIEMIIDLDASWTLDHFVPGDQPWGVPSGPLPAALTDVQVSPSGTLSIDDSGIDHPFRLSDAFQGAMDDLTFSDLREFMAMHPGAQAVQADHWVEKDGSYDVERWSFRMWEESGGTSLPVEAARKIARAGTPEATIQQATGPGDEYWSGTIGLDFTIVNSGAVPDSMPTLADAFSRFTEGTGLVPNTYGFDFTCLMFCWGTSPTVLEVGHVSEVATSPDPVSGAPGHVESLRHRYLFGDDASLLAEYRAEREGVTHAHPLLAGETPMDPEAQATDDLGESRATVWAPPPVEAAAGAGFLALLIGAIYWLWPTIKAAGFMGLFSRLASDQLLQHPVRSGIFETVQQQPGIHYQGLIREVGKGRGVVEHHLRKLQTAGYVVSQSNGGHTCFFPKGIADHRVLAAVPVLKTEGASRVLRHVVKNPGTTVTSMSSALGISKSTASHHVRRLREAGLLDASTRLQSTDAARKALTLAA